MACAIKKCNPYDFVARNQVTYPMLWHLLKSLFGNFFLALACQRTIPKFGVKALKAKAALYKVMKKTCEGRFGGKT